MTYQDNRCSKFHFFIGFWGVDPFYSVATPLVPAPTAKRLVRVTGWGKHPMVPRTVFVVTIML